MKALVIASCMPLLVLAGCATTDPERLAAERESCERMERDMGLGQTHDHGAMKGQGLNPMNLSHARCQQLLSQAQQ